jgi:hypothetical protein
LSARYALKTDSKRKIGRFCADGSNLWPDRKNGRNPETARAMARWLTGRPAAAQIFGGFAAQK